MPTQFGTFKKDWTASRLAAGALTPVEDSLPPGHDGKYSGRFSKLHWVPAAGDLSTINATYGDNDRDLYLLCEVQAEAETDGSVKARFQIHLHKDASAVVGPDDPFVVEVGRLLGKQIDVSGWKEWRAAHSVGRRRLAAEEVFDFFDAELATLTGRPVQLPPSTERQLGDVGSPPREFATPAVTAVSAPSSPSTPVAVDAPTMAERKVFLASRIQGHASAKKVRYKLRAELHQFGFDVYTAESSIATGTRQAMIDRELETSEYFLLVVWDTIGPRSYEEFQLATRTAIREGHPRVYVFLSGDEQHAAARRTDALTQEFLRAMDDLHMYATEFSSDAGLVLAVGGMFQDLDDAQAR